MVQVPGSWFLFALHVPGSRFRVRMFCVPSRKPRCRFCVHFLAAVRIHLELAWNGLCSCHRHGRQEFSRTSRVAGRTRVQDWHLPADRVRTVVGECQNHLQDAVDRGHITEETRGAHDSQAEQALIEIGGLLDYLQSPDAARNAKRIKEARYARRQRRTKPAPSIENTEPRTSNNEPRTRTTNKNRDPGTR
jgi:hypothetical protein